MTDAELNAAVALLLGWPEQDDQSIDFDNPRWWNKRGPCFGPRGGSSPLRPVTDIRDAWLVVEWLREQGCDVELLAGGSGANNVLVQSDHRGWFGPLSTESPMPRAICEAALAWAEARKEATP